jgi:hypothetical protein
MVTPPKAIPIGAVITPANAETPIEPAAMLAKFKKWLKPVMISNAFLYFENIFLLNSISSST